MKKYLSWQNFNNFKYYLLGILLIGLGANLMKVSNLGNGAWDTVNINLRSYLQNILGWQWVSLGMIAFTISTIIMMIVLSYRKNLRFLLMIFPIILASASLDFWNIVIFKDRVALEMVTRIIFFSCGTLVLPLGLIFVIKSSFPALVFDELMLMLVKVFKAKKITYVRLSIEFTGIFIGSVFGYLTFFQSEHSLGVVNIGSFIFTLLLAPIMTFYFKMFKVVRD